MSSLSTLDWALNYARIGWHIFPVVPGSKVPAVTDDFSNGFNSATTDLKLLSKTWRKTPNFNIGVATGKVSGLVVLDADLYKDNVDENLNRFLLENGYGLPRDVTSTTGNGGRHYFFKYPEDIEAVTSVAKIYGLSGVDLRADGGYIVLPPSVHESGQLYQWDPGRSFLDANLPECPDWIKDHASKTRRIVLAFEDDWKIGPGERNIRLSSIAGHLRAGGLSKEEIFTQLCKVNAERCDPPLENDELTIIADGMAKYPARYNRVLEENLLPLIDAEHSDQGFAGILSRQLTGTTRFDHTRNQWLIWRGNWWETDDTGEIYRLTEKVSLEYKAAVSRIADPDRKDVCLKFARSMGAKSRIDAGIALSKTKLEIATKYSDWDTDSSLFAAKNCIIDLKTGATRAGKPEDMIMLHSDVEYQENAKSPLYETFVQQIFDGDEEVIKYVQTAIGYSMTGSTREQVMFLLVGTGANGKSVLLDVLQMMLGQYGYMASFSTFSRGASATAISDDLAAIEGKRFVGSSEVNVGASIDESRIKGLTGGERISARALYQNLHSFYPVCKIWMGVNHQPKVYDDSEGFWRRVRQINFPVRFEGIHRDLFLAEKLRGELPGILNWAVSGAVRWYQEGLVTPESVVVSTAEYRKESDPLSRFLESDCIIGEGQWISVDDFYRAYQNYCTSRKIRINDIRSATNVHQSARSKFNIERHENVEGYPGVGLKTGIAVNGTGLHIENKPGVKTITLPKPS